METIALGVEGMSCGGCVVSVERALERVPGVARVNVSLATQVATVEGAGIDPARLRAAIEDAGYEVRDP
jgi:copper chaperone CopZ